MPAVMNRSQRRVAQKHMRKESAAYPAHLVEVPPSDWPISSTAGPQEVWRSRDYLVQVFSSDDPAVLVRLSVSRSALSAGGWQDNIPREVLQQLKNECGYAMHDALEVYPCAGDVVHVANMRHIFVMRDPVSFAWRARK